MRFDYEKLDVYHQARKVVKELLVHVIATEGIPLVIREQIQKSSTGILFRIAEGTGRITRADRRHNYIIARGLTFEVAAATDLLKDLELLDEEKYAYLQNELYEIAESLFKMIMSLNLKQAQ